MMVLLWLYKNTKTEIKIVITSLTVLFMLPALAVVVLASSGVSLVGEALAAINPVTHLVELFDPNGNKIGELELTTNWPSTGYVSDEFGTHEGWRHGIGLGPHTGIDIANEYGYYGEPITPFMVGTIAYTDNVDDSSCGKHVKLNHEFNITSVYCHMNSAVEIAPGTEVKPGDVIGYMGSTGTSTGAHVHLTTRVYGIAVDPRTFLVGEPEGSTIVSPTF